MSLKPCNLATFSRPYTLYSLPLFTGSHHVVKADLELSMMVFSQPPVPGSCSFFETGRMFVCLFVFLTKFSQNPFWEAVTAPDFQCFVLFSFLSEPQTRSLGQEVYVLPWQRQKLNAMSHHSIERSSIFLPLEVGCLIASWPLNQDYVYFGFC